MDLYPIKTYKLPIRIIVIYLVFTLVLYAFGPFRWITYNPLLFWSLNILYVFSLWLGWVVSLRISSYKVYKKWEPTDEKAVANILRPLIWMNIIIELLFAMRRYRFISFNIPGLIVQIYNGLRNMGLSYSKFQTGIDDISGANLVGGNFVTLVNLLFSFFSFNIVILSGLLFKHFKFRYKILIVFTYVFICFEYLSTGTNIGAFRIILIIVVIFALNFARSQNNMTRKNTSKKKVVFVVSSLIGIVIVLFVFNRIMQSRGGILSWQSNSYNVGGIGLDRNSIVFKIIPSGFYMLVISLSSYLTQGYYGMSLSLKLPWEPGFGFGHNKALQQLFPEYLDPIYFNTYQYRLNNYGWDENIQWHSLYTWFANDFTFWGVIIVLFFIGYIFCKAYTDSLVYNNPFAKVVVYYFVLLCVFIPCNNQLFQSTYILFGFLGSIFLWFITRKGIRIFLNRF